LLDDFMKEVLMFRHREAEGTSGLVSTKKKAKKEKEKNNNIIERKKEKDRRCSVKRGTSTTT
jgi:hypothetical protein